MKKLQLISLIIIFSGLFLAPQAFAVYVPTSNLVVNFEQAPLFSEANFLPGQAVTRYVDVTNNTTDKKIIGVEAKNYTSCSVDCLADQLKLKITDGTNTLYGEVSLTEFFAAGQKKLSELAAGSTTKYYFTITFVPETGNSYQGKEVGFDFDIGIFGQETIGGGDCGNGTCSSDETCSTCPADCGNCGGGGGGSGGGVTGGGGGGVYFGGETDLVIFNEASEPVVSNQTNVTWQTNHVATSRVIYSAETESHIFQLDNPPNYGYAHSTVEDATKTTSHTMNISGLVPGVTYYYRVVSHGSFAISTEHSFTVPGVKAVNTESAEAISYNSATQNTTQSTGSGQVNNSEGAQNQEPAGETTTEKENTPNPFLAALGAWIGKINFCSVFLLIIIVLIILLLLPLAEKSEKEIQQWIISVIVIIVLVILYSLNCPYYKILLLVTAILFVLLLLYRRFKKNKTAS